MPGGARMKKKDDPQQAIKAYFHGLAVKDISSVPWADNATLRTPLNPAGGESALIRGRRAILDFLAGILPARKSRIDRKSTRLNSSHEWISYAVFCLKKKKNKRKTNILAMKNV